MANLTKSKDQVLTEPPASQNTPEEREYFLRQARSLGFSVKECERLLSLYFRHQMLPFR